MVNGISALEAMRRKKLEKLERESQQFFSSDLGKLEIEEGMQEAIGIFGQKRLDETRKNLRFANHSDSALENMRLKRLRLL